MSPDTVETKTHFRTCHLCETMCGIAVDYRGDEILAIRGDEDHVLSKGNICPKSSGLQDVHTDPDRLRKPVKKIDGDGTRSVGMKRSRRSRLGWPTFSVATGSMRSRATRGEASPTTLVRCSA